MLFLLFFIYLFIYFNTFSMTLYFVLIPNNTGGNVTFTVQKLDVVP
jgi:hypothetical protein